MQENKVKVIYGGLLHDLGRLLLGNDAGLSAAQDKLSIKDDAVLTQMAYHQAENLKSAGLDDGSLAYIACIADNIASSINYRKMDLAKKAIDKNRSFESIFNVLNHNDQKMIYRLQTMSESQDINYPEKDKKEDKKAFYAKLEKELCDLLNRASLAECDLNSFLDKLEDKLNFVPASIAKDERADISLYNQAKLTAGVASCIYDYLEEKGVTDYKEALLDEEEEFYKEDTFLMYSMDVSGIQSFIYTIQSKDALKNLRARSFYLEIMMENMVDNLLDTLGLSRVNLIYAGGGHSYILLPNTAKVKAGIEKFEAEANDWFRETFRTDLYVACGYAECCTGDLKNVDNERRPETKGKGSYVDIFMRLSENLSERKSHRYTAENILQLNSIKGDGLRECMVCHTPDKLVTVKENKDGEVVEYNLCPICNGLKNMASDIFENTYFAITNNPEGIPIAHSQYLLSFTPKKWQEEAKEGNYIRYYVKNKTPESGQGTKIWVGDYRAKGAYTFEELTAKSKGIKRLGVLRADVDNLGQAFTSGFEHKTYKKQFVTLSRTAAFSRSLALFFKYYINKFLKNPEFSLTGEKKTEPRNIAIVYSGGDDIFLVGAWDEVVEFGVDLHNYLDKYSEGTLTLSAGIGIFHDKYPISYMADETGELEECSKGYEYKKDGEKAPKNAVTLFSGKDDSIKYKKDKKAEKENVLSLGGSYSWPEFIDEVCGEKLKTLQDFFALAEEKGETFLYKLLELLRQNEEKISLARMAYLLGRLEPKKVDDKQKNKENMEAFGEFVSKIYGWMSGENENERRQLVTAIYIYAYLNRKDNEEVEANGEK